MIERKIIGDSILINDKEFKTGDEVNLNVFRFDWLHGVISNINKDKKTIVIVNKNSSMELNLNHIQDAS